MRGNVRRVQLHDRQPAKPRSAENAPDEPQRGHQRREAAHCKLSWLGRRAGASQSQCHSAPFFGGACRSPVRSRALTGPGSPVLIHEVGRPPREERAPQNIACLCRHPERRACPAWPGAQVRRAEPRPAQLPLQRVLSGSAPCTATGERKEAEVLDVGSKK